MKKIIFLFLITVSVNNLYSRTADTNSLWNFFVCEEVSPGPYCVCYASLNMNTNPDCPNVQFCARGLNNDFGYCYRDNDCSKGISIKRKEEDSEKK
ncbi:MAG: hypothetical protein IPP08_12285 [Chlorobiota bacterium]|nr:MAG: hypothetical protein IPP08_12285 [Chlorobiota bacterium]